MDEIEYERPMQILWVPIDKMPKITQPLCDELAKHGEWLDPSRMNEGLIGLARQWRLE